MPHPVDEILFQDIADTLGDRAFPVTIEREGKTCTGTGLTKRELFAAMAMNAAYSQPELIRGIVKECKDSPRDIVGGIAVFAVSQADALIKALAP